MSEQATILLILAIVWAAIGLFLSVVMGRRGHLSSGWGLLGTTLGPLGVLAALGAARHEDEEQPALIASATSHGGPVDVLVGIDGSLECRQALERVIALFGADIGRLTLATVVPYDDVPTHTRAALAELARHARLSGFATPGQELLYGHPARALVDFAEREGYGLLVIGTRGGGLADTLLGSTATALASGCPVPVLMAGDPAFTTHAA